MVESLHKERGQALVIMVFGVIVLLAMLGLAIDGGIAFLDRRRMQNAADAAALAGTRKLAEAICGEPVDDPAIRAEVDQYAQDNGVLDPANDVRAFYVDKDENQLGEVGDGSIPLGATGVLVEPAEIRHDTFFIRLLGIPEAGASAAALAMTGPPLTGGGGVRPIGVPVEIVDELDEGDPLIIQMSNNCDAAGQCIIIYTDEHPHRGWLNMDYVWNHGDWYRYSSWPRIKSDQTGASDLKVWMANGWQGTLYVGDYIHAKPGQDNSVLMAAPVGTTILAPIFDAFFDCAEEDIPNPNPKSLPDPGAPGCPTQGGGWLYHIVGFVAIKVTGYDTNDHAIYGDIDRLIIGGAMPRLSDSTGYGGSRACETLTQAVTLMK